MKLFDKVENIKVALDLWRSLIIVGGKSLFFGPIFYGLNWLISGHAPTHDMWFAFFFAACAFTSTNKKSSHDTGEGQPHQSETLIVLSASADKNRERYNQKEKHMIITLDLPPTMSARLTEEAATWEQPVEEYVKLLISQAMPKPRNGAELVALLEEDGVIGMWADREDMKDSTAWVQQQRDKATEQAQEKMKGLK